ncbi:hypothetical protein MKY48_16540 [Paenibacillus sp. FSL W8-0187]|jgi:two-component system, OmpR family, sensor histidine kinase CiaH|uniref:hypothetical protein n=1 Tax=unclassified Paenibacillus TaxID=185978 RepID=UPI0030DDD3EF
MIKRTLVRMTIWNSTVVFCLLIMLGGALYGLARYRIYSDIDRQLVFNINLADDFARLTSAFPLGPGNH